MWRGFVVRLRWVTPPTRQVGLCPHTYSPGGIGARPSGLWRQLGGEPGRGDLQLCDFPLLEDRETPELELCLTSYVQEPDPPDWATARC